MCRFSPPNMRLFIALVVAFLLLTLLVLPTTLAEPVGEGATMFITTPNDIVADDGLCSLREAITSTNNNEAPYHSVGECPDGNGADTILLTNGIYGIGIADPDHTDENDNASGDFDIYGELTIRGIDAEEAEISGSGIDRVLHIHASAIVRLDTIGIFGGKSANGAPGDNGSGYSGEGGGGIMNEGTLTLPRSVVHDNQTGIGGDGTGGNFAGGGPGGDGAGIYNLNTGILILTDTLVRNNGTGRGGYGVTTTPGAGAGAGGSGGSGGGIYNGLGQLFLYNSEVSDNQTGPGGGGGSGLSGGRGGNGGVGAGIVNIAGIGAIRGSQISHNNAGGGGYGGMNTETDPREDGQGGGVGGVFNSGTMTIDDSIINHNATGSGTRGGDGGGIYASGFLTLTNSVVAFNTTGTTGGYPYYFEGGAGGGLVVGGGAVVTITQTTIRGNRADISGGNGIFVYGTLYLHSSTITRNGGGGFGGGLRSEIPESSIFIEDSTISENSAGGGGGIGINVGTVTLYNTIIANNNAGTLPDCAGTYDKVPTVTSDGYLIIGDASDCVFTGETAGVQLNVDPRLGIPITDEDGVAYYPLLPDSPAVDFGECSTSIVDQRGSPRPVDLPLLLNLSDGCDVGAIESQLVAVSPHHVSVSEMGLTDTYSITLTYPPTAPITITLSAGGQVTTTPALLVIPTDTWSLPQTITVRALSDTEDEALHFDTITHTVVSSDSVFNHVPVANVNARIADTPPDTSPIPSATPTQTRTPTITPTQSVPPTQTPYPTFTPYPTDVPYPTFTPGAPVPTKQPHPTYTPYPTYTPAATYTPAVPPVTNALYLPLIHR